MTSLFDKWSLSLCCKNRFSTNGQSVPFGDVVYGRSLWSRKLSHFVCPMYHKKVGKFYTISMLRKVATFCVPFPMYHKKVGKFYTICMITKVKLCVHYVTQKSRQVLYYTYAPESCHFLCRLYTTKK